MGNSCLNRKKHAKNQKSETKANNKRLSRIISSGIFLVRKKSNELVPDFNDDNACKNSASLEFNHSDVRISRKNGEIGSGSILTSNFNNSNNSDNNQGSTTGSITIINPDIMKDQILKPLDQNPLREITDPLPSDHSEVEVPNEDKDQVKDSSKSVETFF